MFYFNGNIALKGVSPEQARQLEEMDHRSLGAFIDKAAILCMTQDKFRCDPVIPDASFSIKDFYIGKKRWVLLKPFVDICEKIDCSEIPKSILAGIAISRVLNGYFEVTGEQAENELLNKVAEKEKELEMLEYPPVSRRRSPEDKKVNTFHEEVYGQSVEKGSDDKEHEAEETGQDKRNTESERVHGEGKFKPIEGSSFSF